MYIEYIMNFNPDFNLIFDTYYIQINNNNTNYNNCLEIYV